MLERKITTSILNWYRNDATALLIDGARQVGKTTVIENFLKTRGLDYVEINLLENKLAREAFDTSTNAEQLLLRLSALTKKELVEKETIIFVDEIQEAQDALTPIKFLVRNSNYNYIFSGSLLGVKMQDIQSIPVGFLSVLQMYPLDFVEFCKAVGVSQKTLDYLKDCFANEKKVDDIIHKQMMDLFHTYMVVGGMPQAVVRFLETHDINQVNNVLNDVDFGYRQDIAKYQKENRLLIQEIYDLIPSQLNAQNKRFVLKELNEKARFYQYETSFTWLKNSGVGLFVHNVDNPVYPLLASKERTLFKLFLNDVGLLTFKLYGGNQITILNGDSNLNYGAVYEAVVAQELKSHHFDLFYNNDKKRGEIDFLIEKDNKVIPLEIKSGKDYKRHSALSKLLEDESYGCETGIVFCSGNVEKKERVVYLPVYMVAFLEKSRSQDPRIVHLDISKLI